MGRKMLPENVAINLLYGSCVKTAEVITEQYSLLVDNRGYKPKIVSIVELRELESKEITPEQVSFPVLHDILQEYNNLPYLKSIDMGNGHYVPVYSTRDSKRLNDD